MSFSRRNSHEHISTTRTDSEVGSRLLDLVGMVGTVRIASLARGGIAKETNDVRNSVAGTDTESLALHAQRYLHVGLRLGIGIVLGRLGETLVDHKLLDGDKALARFLTNCPEVAVNVIHNLFPVLVVA